VQEPSSGAAPSILLDRVEYRAPAEASASWTLQVSWSLDPQHTPKSAQVQLYADQELHNPLGSGVEAAVEGPAQWSEQAAGYTLQAGRQYWIAVDTFPPPRQSNGLPVLWLPLRLVSLAFGDRHLDFAWQPPAVPFNDYQVSLATQAGEVLGTWPLGTSGFSSSTAGVSAARLDLDRLPLPLLGGRLPCSLRQTYVEGTSISLGPPVDAQAYTSPPEVISAVFDTGEAGKGLTYTATLRTPGDNTPDPGFAVTVTADGLPYSGPILTASSPGPDQTHLVTVQIPPAPGPSTGQFAGEFALVLARADALSTGPAATPLTLDTIAPAVTCAAYSRGELTLSLAQPPAASALATITSDEGKTITQAVIHGARGTVPFTAEAGRDYFCSAAAVTARTLGPEGPRIQLVTEAPALTEARYDAGVVSASWTDHQPASAPWYVLRVLGGGRMIAQATTGAASAALAVADPGVPLTVELSACAALPQPSGAATGAGAVEGPACDPVALLMAAPVGLAAATDPVGGVTGVSWQPLPGVSGYAVRLYLAGIPAGPPVIVDEPSWTLPQPLVAGLLASVTVAAVAVHAGVSVIGPACPPLLLPALRPGPGAAGYDGVAASVSWGAAAGAAGYVVSILADGAVVGRAEVDSTATAVSIPLGDMGAAADYRAVVQARTGAGTGPATDPVPLLVPALFLSASAPSVQQPHLFPAVDPADIGGDLVAYLPELGRGGPLKPLPVSGPFALAATGDAAYPYRLTIAAKDEDGKDSGVWVFDPATPIRAALRAAFEKFLVAAETAGAGAPGITTLQNTIARVLPQTFTETLYYGGGFNTMTGTADLRPGTVLRISSADYQYISQTTPPKPDWYNGYSAGSVVDLDIGGYLGSGARWQLGVDAFVARLIAAGLMDVTAPETSGRNEAGSAAGADLFAATMREPYLRLFAPSALQSPTGVGSISTTANFVLASASTYNRLQTTLNYPTTDNFTAYFRGRAVLTVCVRVSVDGAALVVPLGTTVGDLLDRCGRRPAAAASKVAGIWMRRPSAPAVFALPADGEPAQPAARAIRFDWGRLPVYGPGYDAFSLPVLPGDQLLLGS
jgi:hypothetical protein